jgi:CheY-like chemotaxis protein
MSNYPAILYVEDDLQSRVIMQVLLEEALGLQHVTIFENSADFMHRVHALDHKPDLIFLDIHVRPHTGFEMLEMLRADPAFEHTPVVALTASVMNEEVVRLRTSGFNSVIGKPIDQDLFPKLMQQVLNGEEIWRIVS